jgi:hypothetical protein
MKVLLVSLECLGPVVSGNGMYAAAIRRAAMCCSALITGVMVLCGTPDNSHSLDSAHPVNSQDQVDNYADVLFVPVILLCNSLYGALMFRECGIRLNMQHFNVLMSVLLVSTV